MGFGAPEYKKLEGTTPRFASANSGLESSMPIFKHTFDCLTARLGSKVTLENVFSCDIQESKPHFMQAPHGSDVQMLAADCRAISTGNVHCLKAKCDKPVINLLVLLLILSLLLLILLLVSLLLSLLLLLLLLSVFLTVIAGKHYTFIVGSANLPGPQKR